MRFELINEFDVNISADDVWEVYSSPNLPKLIVDLLPVTFEKIDFVEGNGGLGTAIHLVYPPGMVPLTYKEKLVTIDKCKCLKEVQQVGGYLDVGVTFYMDSLEIIEKVCCDSCTITMARGISKYVLDKKQNSCSSDENYPKKVYVQDGGPCADDDKHVHGRDRSFHC